MKDNNSTPAADSRSGNALCLSGGGYRAALFHLGALQRLNELGVLSKIDTFSSVSGGSILAAHLCEVIPKWPKPGTAVADWEEIVVRPFLEFTGRNVRTGPVLRRMLPWNWFRTETGARALAAAFRRHLTKLDLVELPRGPRMVFCATDMVFGVNWVFDTGVERLKPRVGDFQAGYAHPREWPLADAVAASACFPPVFNPISVGLAPEALTTGRYQGPDRERLIGDLRLTDGGVYDNLALEPVWKDHAVVLVSDGGAIFQTEGSGNLVKRLLRYNTISGRGGTSMRKRWQVDNYQRGVMGGCYWGIGGATTDYEPKARGYSKSLAERVISRVRTDMDPFSVAEQRVLQNHGYLLADAAIQRYAPELVTIAAPLRVPYEKFLDEAVVARELAGSGDRHILGRRQS